MKLSRHKKILVGVLSCLPTVYLLLFILLAFLLFFGESIGVSVQSQVVIFDAVFPLHFLLVLLNMGLITFYTIYLFKTDRVAEDKKALWAVVIFVGSMLAIPIFWYLYIWREKETQQS